MSENLAVLLVDDEVEYLETMAKRLTRRGFSVTTAGSCQAAMAQLAAAQPQVMVLDVMLPDMDGITCLQAIKAQWPAVAVILLTGHASIQTGLKGMAHGASDYCLKPIEFEELVEKIRIVHREVR